MAGNQNLVSTAIFDGVSMMAGRDLDNCAGRQPCQFHAAMELRFDKRAVDRVIEIRKRSQDAAIRWSFGHVPTDYPIFRPESSG